jgi:hypothetical protein
MALLYESLESVARKPWATMSVSLPTWSVGAGDSDGEGALSVALGRLVPDHLSVGTSLSSAVENNPHRRVGDTGVTHEFGYGCIVEGRRLPYVLVATGVQLSDEGASALAAFLRGGGYGEGEEALRGEEPEGWKVPVSRTDMLGVRRVRCGDHGRW